MGLPLPGQAGLVKFISKMGVCQLSARGCRPPGGSPPLRKLHPIRASPCTFFGMLFAIRTGSRQLSPVSGHPLVEGVGNPPEKGDPIKHSDPWAAQGLAEGDQDRCGAPMVCAIGRDRPRCLFARLPGQAIALRSPRTLKRHQPDAMPSVPALHPSRSPGAEATAPIEDQDCPLLLHRFTPLRRCDPETVRIPDRPSAPPPLAFRLTMARFRRGTIPFGTAARGLLRGSHEAL